MSSTYYLVIIGVGGLILNAAMIYVVITNAHHKLRDMITEKLAIIETTQKIKFDRMEKDINELFNRTKRG